MELSIKEGDKKVELSMKEGDKKVELSMKEGDKKVELSMKEGDKKVELFNMMLTWPGGERKASDDFIFIFVLTKR